MPTLCQTFRKEAGVTWNRMRKAAALGLSLSEETLTECALYNIALVHQGTDIVIDLATKHAEDKHGADWEWWLIRGNKGLGFRVQAKRLFPNGRYDSLTVTGAKAYQQLDKLVSTAKTGGFEPLYCFFNFSHPQGGFHEPNPCKHVYRAPSFWGCSLGFPDQVKTAKSNQVEKLKPIMHPWHTLVCESPTSDLLTAATTFLTQKGRRENVRLGDLPTRVRRLIELGDERRRAGSRDRYLDRAYWDDASDTPENLAGIVAFRDIR